VADTPTRRTAAEDWPIIASAEAALMPCLWHGVNGGKEGPQPLNGVAYCAQCARRHDALLVRPVDVLALRDEIDRLRAAVSSPPADVIERAVGRAEQAVAEAMASHPALRELYSDNPIDYSTPNRHLYGDRLAPIIERSEAAHVVDVLIARGLLVVSSPEREAQ
jgi:hypothetical protein